MRIVIASNIGNGIGLEKDYKLLRAFLESEGHEVDGQQFDQPAAVEPGDLLIWLEVISEHLLSLAPRSWIFCNPEWTKPEYVRPIQRHCERVFAKTRDAERELKQKFQNVSYVGFLTEDKRLTAIPVLRERRFLHIGGNSGYRNTNAVISAWREYRYWDGKDIGAELTVVSNSNVTAQFADTPGIRFIKRTTDEEIQQLQNSHLFHLFPSAYEGWGHAVHEAQSVGAVLLTTDAAPMNEMKAPFHVPSVRKKRNNLGTLHEVSPVDIRETVKRMLVQPAHVLTKMSMEARSRFEKGNEEFKTLFRPHLKGSTERSAAILAPRTSLSTSKPRIALLGNFEPPFSTENDLLWTLRDMGYSVTPFQENKDRTEEIAEFKGDLLIYVHTHGWQTPGQISLDEMLVTLRSRKVKTASFHLDRYVGLNISDGRESRVGSHPFWRTDTVFTADGGNDEFFKARSINHVWLPPGVIKRDCYLGESQPEIICDVGFVGATGYHPEYPFRGQLIEFLRGAYGDRFLVFQGYRGERLNNLYASIRVVVGDSCFGGADYYWSDRVPETTGRGGFLIHPECKGLTIPGLATFTPCDLSELQDRIDYFLDRPVERTGLQHAAHAWVRENETYHNRMQRLLGMMGV